MKLGNLILIMVAMTLLLSMNALALNVTIGAINTPVTGTDAIDGTYNFSVTYNSTTLKNITVLAGSTVICSSTVITNDQTLKNATCTYDTTGLTDGTYTITFGFWMLNGSTDGNTTATGVIVDNTAPTAVLTVDFDKFEPTKLFTGDCSRSTDALDSSLTYSQVLTKPDATTVTKTNAVSTFSETDTDLKGEYTLACTVTDNAGSTSTQSATIRAASSTPSVVINPAVSSTGSARNNTFVIVVVSLVILLIGATAIVVAMTGKKR